MSERKKMADKNCYSKEAEERANRGIQKIMDGKVRNHKLRNGALVHSGELEEQECNAFLEFLMTRNYFLIDELRGYENA